MNYRDCDHEWYYPNDLYFDLEEAVGDMVGAVNVSSPPVKTHICRRCGARLLQKLKVVEYDILPGEVFDEE